MNKDNLNPKGKLRSLWEFLKNNRGFADPAPVADPPADPAVTPPVGPPADPPASPPVAPITLENWRNSVDVDIREHPALANFKDVNALAKSHVEVQKIVGAEKLPVPPKDATLDSKEFGMVFDRLGRPSDPKNYGIPQVEYPDGMSQTTTEQFDEFKQAAHKIGLLPAQVEALVSFQHERNVNAYNQMNEAYNTELQQAETKLRGKLGKAFDAEMARAQGLITKFGGEEVSKLVGASGLGRNPVYIEFMMNIAKNFGEDGELLGEPSMPHILSPEQALEEINAIKADKDHAWHKRDNPEHETAMKKMQHLFEMAYPEKPR